MIQIDMEMPKNCICCPCIYFIRYGPYRDMPMCQLMEYIHMKQDKSEFLVYPNDIGRPDKCPMMEVKP